MQGLRAIEGVQEFFLIVARPEHIDGLCVEAFLETGHFPEQTPIIQPPVEYEEAFEEFSISKRLQDWPSACEDFEKEYTIDEGWIIDRRPNRKDGRQGDPGHPGVQFDNNSNPHAKEMLHNHNVNVIPNATVHVSGRFCSVFGQEALLNHTYRVLTRSQEPKRLHEQPHADVDYLLITNRSLCVCFKSGDCPEVLPQPDPPIIDNVVVDEPVIRINPALLTRTTHLSRDNLAVKRLKY